MEKAHKGGLLEEGRRRAGVARGEGRAARPLHLADRERTAAGRLRRRSTSWPTTRCSAAARVVVGREGAEAQIQRGVDCTGCHREHRPPQRIVGASNAVDQRGSASEVGRRHVRRRALIGSTRAARDAGYKPLRTLSSSRNRHGAGQQPPRKIEHVDGAFDALTREIRVHAPLQTPAHDRRQQRAPPDCRQARARPPRR